nr:RagB/SusD family nutrient uptake outer membrane protein [uncultured Carboxylicivirga sp.]
MKQLIYFAAIALVFFTSCEDFLDTENLTEKNTTNFPANEGDVEQAVIGIYNTLNTAVANPQCTYFYAAELASDDRFGGGGTDDKLMQAWDKIMNFNTDASRPFWLERYKGIFRANSILLSIERMGLEGDNINKMKGEAYFLRAFFYHELAEMYGEVPMPLNSDEAENLPKSSAPELYAQIASDLLQAIDLLPSVPYNEVEAGHVTKWAAEALLARVFLFYTGYYDQSSITLTDGTSLTKDQVVTDLEDCIDNSGHDLVGDFRNLWAYTNPYSIDDFAKVAGKNGVDGNPLGWVGDGNKESVFAIKFSNFASWSTTIGYSNQYLLHFGVRGGQPYGNTFPLGQGWGAGPVSPQLWNDWRNDEPNDLRRESSIMPVADLDNYAFGQWTMMEETDYWQMKCVHISAKKGVDAEGNTTYYSSFSVPMFEATDNFQLDGVNDLMLIRFADVLLMHSELTQTADGINRVRERAGLDDISYSLDALKKERRYELAFEGRRYADIRRWGDAPDLLEKQLGQKLYESGKETVMKAFGGGYKARYNATGGFFPIPESEIALSNGVLEQTPGYSDASANYTGW